MTYQHSLILNIVMLLLVGGNSSALGKCGSDKQVLLIQSNNAIERRVSRSVGESVHLAGGAKAASVTASLWNWVIAHSSYDTQTTWPRIEFRSTEFFSRNLCPPGTHYCSIGGYYEDGSGVIFMRNDHQLDDVRSRAMLAHELIHYLQDRSGIWNEKSCMNRILREREAYDLQQRYLVAHHGNPFGIRVPELDESLCSEHIN